MEEAMKTHALLFVAATVLLNAHLNGADEQASWHIRAVHPDGMFLDVNAIDKDGKTHPVKALKTAGNGHLLDIKAIVDGKTLPVKILVSDDLFAPVKAIAE